MEKKEIKVPIAALIYICLFLFAVMNIAGFLNSHMLVHIKTGEWMIENEKIIKNDIFSFMAKGEWINYYWLTDIIYAYLYKVFGIGAILILHASIIAGAFTTAGIFLYKKRVNILLITSFFMIGMYASLPQWSALPYSFNFLFLMLFIYWFDSYYESGNKIYLCFLVFLEILWVNMNSEFFYPFIIILIYIIFEIISILKKEKKDMINLKRLGIVLTVYLPILLINPYGIKEIMNVISGYIFMIKDRRNDWTAPDFHGFAKYSNIFLAFSVITLFVFKKAKFLKERKYITIYLVVVVAFLYAQRHIMIFSLISIIFLPLMIEYDKNIKNKFINNLNEKSNFISEKIYKMSSGKIMNIILILVVTIMFLVYVRGSEGNFKEIMSSWARSSGVKYLNENKIEGNGFHSDAHGDMIIWYNYPETKVFVDSRDGVYSGKHQNNYAKIMLLKDDWEKIIEENKINWILLQQSQITNILKILDDKWVVVYESGAAVLFLKKEYYEKVKDRIKIVKE